MVRKRGWNGHLGFFDLLDLWAWLGPLDKWAAKLVGLDVQIELKWLRYINIKTWTVARIRWRPPRQVFYILPFRSCGDLSHMSTTNSAWAMGPKRDSTDTRPKIPGRVISTMCPVEQPTSRSCPLGDQSILDTGPGTLQNLHQKTNYIPPEDLVTFAKISRTRFAVPEVEHLLWWKFWGCIVFYVLEKVIPFCMYSWKVWASKDRGMYHTQVACSRSWYGRKKV